MTEAPVRGVRLAEPRRRRRPAVWVAVILVVAGGLAWGIPVAWEAIQGGGTPSCSWPLEVRGTATPEQAGLVRCYLRALASRDTAGLMAVAADIPPVRITSADLAHSADARGGLATATFTQNAVDPTSAFVTITFADGVQEQDVGLENMIAMGGPEGWRVTIGTVINPGPAGPPPAGTSP